MCKAGRIVENDCWVPLKLAGWEPTGEKKSLQRSGSGTKSHAKCRYMLTIYGVQEAAARMLEVFLWISTIRSRMVTKVQRYYQLF